MNTRRMLEWFLVWGTIALLLALASVTHAGALRTTRITVTVGDLAQTEAFYRDGLGFRRVRQSAFQDAAYAHLLGVRNARVKSLVMKLGDEEVEFQEIAPRGRPYPSGSRSPDLWFQHFAVIVSDMDKAYAHLRRQRFVSISDGGPVTLPPDHGSVKAFKFRDPDGHPLELLYFPKGVGRAAWNRSGDKRLFLGIDHSAIGVSNTPASRRFYEGLLGMHESYTALNTGETQERLDGTFNAIVQITGLWPESNEGPGVEFLEYRAPSIGRATPADVMSNDISHVHLTITVDNLDKLGRKLFDARAPMLSPGVVEVNPELSGFRKGLMVKDPDGHALLLTE